MEDKISKDLYNMNKEYLELKDLYNKRNHSTIKKAINLIKNGEIRYLFSIFMEKKSMRKHISINSCKDVINSDEKNEINEKIAVYTCIIGSYDIPIDPVYISKRCDYYIITDQDIPNNSVWKKIDINKFKINNLNNNEINRFIKLHPHLIFQEYNYSIYLDGNVKIISDLSPMVSQLGKKSIGLHIHSFRNCAYKEGKSFKFNKRLNSFYPIVKKQLEQYKKEGFPSEYSLYENTIIVRNHSRKDCILIMETWWEQLKKYSFRDQISLPYVIWKLNMKEEVFIYGILKKNYRLRLYKHGRT